jgi:hypothetical protein
LESKRIGALAQLTQKLHPIGQDIDEQLRLRTALEGCG